MSQYVLRPVRAKRRGAFGVFIAYTMSGDRMIQKITALSIVAAYLGLLVCPAACALADRHLKKSGEASHCNHGQPAQGKDSDNTKGACCKNLHGLKHQLFNAKFLSERPMPGVFFIQAFAYEKIVLAPDLRQIQPGQGPPFLSIQNNFVHSHPSRAPPFPA